ncbi:secreted RxLR effector protein 161-like [Nicotiana tabacum]|uniref:Secreted RxLR effector protein 161-like n=1 Tax=Nicotiana tabacum TaxID=4097 RepID=A0AC58TW13_TOBAC
MKDLGEAKKILGIEIKKDRHSKKLYLSQKEYLKRVIDRFGMNENTKSVSTHLAPHFKLSATMSPKNEAERECISRIPYVNVVGSLMYAIVCTRSDISHVIGVVSRYMHDPGKEHWQAVKWIVWYIRNTVDVGLIFEQKDSQYLVGYCDSDYAGDLEKCRSTTGYIFTFANTLVSWKSTLQSMITLSTTEAEYMAITEAVKKAIWLQGLPRELGIGQESITLFCKVKVLSN